MELAGVKVKAKMLHPLHHLSSLLLCYATLLCLISGEGLQALALEPEAGGRVSLDGQRSTVAVEHAGKRVSRDNLLGSSRPVEDKSALEKFLGWLEENGAYGVSAQSQIMEIVAVPLINTNVTEAQEGRVEYGLLAKRDFKVQETLMSLPPGLWITSKDLSLANVDVGKAQERGRPPTIPPAIPGMESDWDAAAALFLLSEKAKGNDSFWSPFLNMLPACDHVPAMFTLDEILQIQYRPMIFKIREMLHHMRDVYVQIKKAGLLPEGGKSLKDIQWAFSMIWSRSFNVYPENWEESAYVEAAAEDEVAEEEGELVDATMWADDLIDGDPEKILLAEPGEGEAGPGAKFRSGSRRKGGKGSEGGFASDDKDNAYMLLPYMDMLNHDFNCEAEWAVGEGRVQLVAVRGGEKGKPVYTNYGLKGNDDYLLSYGFLPDPNPYDSARLFPTRYFILNWYSENYVKRGRLENDSDLMAPISTGFDVSSAEPLMDEALEVADEKEEIWTRIMTEEEEGHGDGGVEGEQALPLTESGPEYDFDEETSGFEVWPKAHVEPRLLLMLAVLRYSHLKAAEGYERQAAAMEQLDNGDLEDMVHISISIGRSILGASKCSDIAEKFAPFFTFAAQAVRERALAVLSSYATTLEEDAKLLRCAGMEANNDDEDLPPQERTCPWTETLSSRMKAIVKFRFLKKQLLANAASRLDRDCGLPSVPTA